MSIATRTGDDGTTALMFGRRVSKAHPRVAACGAVDELNSALGMVRALTPSEPAFVEMRETLLSVQQDLVLIMGELAVLPEDLERYREKGYDRLEDSALDLVDSQIRYLEEDCALNFSHWATPGANPISAACEVARTAVRRAERYVVTLHEGGQRVPALILQYLNRLSDLCWLYARYAEAPVPPPATA